MPQDKKAPVAKSGFQFADDDSSPAWAKGVAEKEGRPSDHSSDEASEFASIPELQVVSEETALRLMPQAASADPLSAPSLTPEPFSRLRPKLSEASPPVVPAPPKATPHVPPKGPPPRVPKAPMSTAPKASPGTAPNPPAASPPVRSQFGPDRPMFQTAIRLFQEMEVQTPQRPRGQFGGGRQRPAYVPWLKVLGVLAAAGLLAFGFVVISARYHRLQTWSKGLHKTENLP